MGEQIAEIDRVPDDSIQPALHHTAIRRQQTEAVSERNLPADDDEQAQPEQRRRGGSGRSGAIRVGSLRSGKVIETAVTRRTNGRRSTTDGRLRHVNTTTRASPTSSRRSVALFVSRKSPQAPRQREKQRAHEEPRRVLAGSRRQLGQERHRAAVPRFACPPGARVADLVEEVGGELGRASGYRHRLTI